MTEIDILWGRRIGAQHWEDLALWESALNNHPGLAWIVELGTWQGGMSFFLKAQALARAMTFATVDIIEPADGWVPDLTVWDLGRGLPPTFNVASAPGVLFCDNGDKRFEVRSFASLLHRDSLVVVHDWGDEFTASDIPEGMAVYDSGIKTVVLKWT